ncbi:MAG TPA: S8 family serine peptidase [Herpetosiphonaceae bacterium]
MPLFRHCRKAGRARWLGALLLIVSASAGGHAVARQDAVDQAAPPESAVLEVKFREGSAIRLRDGRPADLGGSERRGPADQALRDIAGTWWRSHDVSEATLDEWQSAGAARLADQGDPRGLPNLNLYLQFRPADPAASALAFERLRALPEVEAVYRVPAPAEAPSPGDYYAPALNPLLYQSYQNAAPLGIGSRLLDDEQAYPGARGAGVSICDIEDSWNADHRDLPPVTLLGPEPTAPFTVTAARNHGTASLGVMGGLDDGAGITGIAHEAQFYFSLGETSAPTETLQPAAAITRCAAAMGPGDIILVEQHMRGPRSSGSGQFGFMPVEWYRPAYDAIRTVTANQRIVIEPAGNGAQNLDDPFYQQGNDGHWPFLPANDSGAIMVGAGRAFEHSRLSFSNWGGTVDVQGWGQSVVTTGYGNLYAAEGENAWYAHGWSGTSSASAIVAGAAANLQAFHRRLNPGSPPLTAAEIRLLFQRTGTQQGGVEQIGPLPNVPAALESIRHPLQAVGSVYLPLAVAACPQLCP